LQKSGEAAFKDSEYLAIIVNLLKIPISYRYDPDGAWGFRGGISGIRGVPPIASAELLGRAAPAEFWRPQAAL